MGKDFQNKLGLLVILLFSIAPFVGFIAIKAGLKIFQVDISAFSLLALYFIFLKGGYLRVPKYVFLWFLFALYTLISDAFIAKTINLLDPVAILFYDTYFVCFYVLLVIENVRIPDNFYSKIKTITKVVLIIAFIVILVQGFISTSFFVSPRSYGVVDLINEEEFRLPSIYSWLGSSAYMGLAYFPLLAIIICEALKENGKYIWILFFMGAIVAFLNKSRFMMLNYLVIFSLIPLYRKVNFLGMVKVIALILGLTVASYYGAKAVNYDIDKVVNDRILESGSGSVQNSSAGTRLIAIQVFSDLFPRNPILGKGMLHGFGTNGSKDMDLVRAIHGRSSQIHVGFLSLFYYYGLIGGGLYLLFLFFLFRKLYKDAKATHFWAVFITWIMFFLTNLTLVSLDILNMGLILSLFFNNYYISKIDQNEVIA